ncbi:Peroxisomal membrane signal receptor PTS1 [Serendipita sp. 407]|nr:Peroxisomal membrane signal receptor PTS1 [Serendipita sp. 397]KAG9053847.1 Peroxisomal membrane signal receptor PTS1 [Serendipita sp. 407]
MSFSSLISGADCSTSSNPLSQVLKHTDVDNSLQRDRFGGASGPSLQHLPRTQSPLVNQADMASARQFFQQNGPALIPGGPLHSPLTMGLPTPPMVSSGSATPLLEFEKWKEQQAKESLPGNMGETLSISRQHQPVLLQQPEFAPTQAMSHLPLLQQRYPSPMMMMQPPILHTTIDKGKGRAVDHALEAAFEALESQTKAMGSDNSTELDKAMDQLRLEQDAKSQSQPALSDFQRIWRDINAAPSAETLEEMAKWEKEFNEAMSSQREDGDLSYEDAINAQFKGLDKEFGLPTEELKVDGDGMPILRPYDFESDNKYLQEPGTSVSLEAAKTLLREGGSLSDVALLLEAAIQQKDLGEGGYEAWILLGEVRSMDEREEQGMLALREGIKIAQEQGGAGGVGLLSLAISYTNEGYDRPSQLLLLNWLRIRYPEHTSSVSIPSTTTQPWAVHEIVQDAFLSVARIQQADPNPDPELQVGLGVLLYIKGEFTKASDCFASALSMRPEDYVLWNRYGSCLSNGNRPEDSLTAYREALRLRPKYTRALYNVGVACLNLGAFKEAAEHFLHGLALQGDETNKETKRSEQLWATLRRTLIAMDRADLADKAKDGNLDLFRKEGFEF